MTPMTRLRFSALLVLVALGPAVAEAQVLEGREVLDFDRPESWAMKYFGALTLLSGFGPHRPLAPGTVVVGLEAAWVPELSLRQRTVGFAGTKEEDINRTSIFGRPRILVGLPARMSLEASYLPPIELDGVEPDLVAVAIGRPLVDGRRYLSGWRVGLQRGTLAGDFTCSAAEIEHGPNPFDCTTPSRDRMTTRSVGVEVSMARRPTERSRLEPYVTVGGHHLDLEFLVRAEYQGLNDRTRLLTDGAVASLTLGLTRESDRGLRWSGELFYSPLRVVRPPDTRGESDPLLHARVFVSYRLR